MSAVSVFSDISVASSAPPAGASASAAASNAASNPFVALLSGLMGPGANSTLSDVTVDASVAESGFTAETSAFGVLNADAIANLEALSDDVLAQLPSDIASALADVAQALGQLKSSLTGATEASTAALDAQAVASDDDSLTASSLSADPLMTMIASPMLMRQSLGAPSSAVSLSDDAAQVAAGGLTSRQSHGASASFTTEAAETVAEVLAKPSNSPNFSSALNNTSDMLAVAKDSVALAPSLSALKEAVMQAGVSADQVDHMLNLSAQGQAAPNTAALSASGASPAAAPANSQWTVPGHALLDNSAWSSAMTDRLTWLGQNGMTSASLHITPDDLGPIHVRIQMGEEGAKVSFSADHHDTQGLIERMLPKLTAAFEAQGIRLDDVRVQSGASQAAQMDFSQQQQGREAAAQQTQASMNGSGQDARSGASAGNASGSGDAALDVGAATVSAASNNSQLDAYA